MHIHFDRLLPAFLALGCALATFGSAGADPLILTPQTCTVLNCGAVTLPGRINPHPASPAFANSWVGQFSGAASHCMRFQVVSESRDLTMTVVAPNGTTFRNDNGGVAACTACPKVVVAAAANGFYTVVVANKNAVTAEANFGLRVGLYDTGINNPNCASPTTGQ